MNIGNIAIGLDIATAVSVLSAAIAFIWNNARESKKDRELDILEKQKDRDARLNEFTLNKASEIIQFLNDKLHRLLLINDKIDLNLNISKKAKHRDNLKAELPREIKNNIYINCRREGVEDITSIPELMWVSPLLEEVIDLTREISSYLSHHPYVRFLNDDRVTDSVDKLTCLYLDLTITKNLPNNENRTIIMKVKDYEKNSAAFGYFLRRHIQYRQNKKLHILASDKLEGMGVDINDTSRNKDIEDVCVEVFNELDSDTKANLYIRFIVNQLTLLVGLRDEWCIVTERVKETISVFSDYSYKIIIK